MVIYNGKPYELNGWFGGTIIFRNTHHGIVDDYKSPTLRIMRDPPIEGWMNLQFAGVFCSSKWRQAFEGEIGSLGMITPWKFNIALENKPS